MYQKPSSSICAKSPWTQTAGEARPVGLQVAVGVAPEAARHAGPGVADDQFADRAAHRARRSSSTTSTAMPGTGAEKQVGFSGRMVKDETIPPEISVPPE